MRDDIRDALIADLGCLASQAMTSVCTDGQADEHFRGLRSMQKMSRDHAVMNLPSFHSTVERARELPGFQATFGDDLGPRVTVQLVYDCFTKAAGFPLTEEAASSAVDSLLAELARPEWVYVSVANLRNFESDDALLDFGRGMTVRRRSHEELSDALGWTDWHLQFFGEDWSDGMGAGEHVVYVEEHVPKSPEQALRANTATGITSIHRLLLALRLFRSGDVAIGAVFHERPALFDLRPRGLSRIRSGLGGGSFANPYTLAASEVESVRHILVDLERFDELADVPKNIRLAFRRFTSIYERDQRQAEDRILDAVTALEALFGSKHELAFKLAFRVSGILGGTDAQRVSLFTAMKQFYRTRSAIVHGETLKAAELALVEDDAPLRSVVRQVLGGVLRLTLNGAVVLNDEFVNERLDGVLLDGAKRNELRSSMGLDRTMLEQTFRMGDVFDADDEVAVYLVNVAMGFNDIVYAVVKGGEAIAEWEGFYWSRLYAAHFFEAMHFVARRSTRPNIRSFIDGLPDETQSHYRSALNRYEALRGRLQKVRSRTVFHYETGEAATHVQAAIAKNADSTGVIRPGPDGAMLGARNVFADIVLSSLVVEAAGGSGENVGHLVDELLEAVQEFMRFVNGALDHWLLEHRDSVATEKAP